MSQAAATRNEVGGEEERPIRKVLIANRGEIAVRIARTLRREGITSVLVYHVADARSPARELVDEAYEIGGEPPVAAYLDSRAILDVARRAGADAVHPGYGFLSENAAFAQAAADAGLVFIGPQPEVIRLMGDKIASRDFVHAHGFRVAPSASEEDDPATFLERARAVGFPLLIKASAGGGGKGMQIVETAAELGGRAEAAKREAERYFGDGRIYAERYITRPRHIEVQVLGDHHGNCVHLFERDCSVQRRFQKIVEESPAPGLSDAVRRRICGEAVGIAKAAGYRNAGTVEFILTPEGDFYFLEMNTRLQVEHPVTEMVTGLDLVAEQIRIAAGRPLSFSQKDIAARGHAVEVRIYAEDPENGFLPATGQLLTAILPPRPGVRFDSGVRQGQRVTADFDPMLVKLIAHGEDRDEALARAREALWDTVLLGVTTNIDYLARVLGHPAFAAGDVHTGFVVEHGDALKQAAPDDTLETLLLATAALSDRGFNERVRAVPEPFASMGRWRN